MAERLRLNSNLINAAFYAFAAVICYIVFVLFQPGQQVDTRALGADFLTLSEVRKLEIFGLVRWGSIAVLSIIAVILGCAALTRGQLRLVSVTFLCSVTVVACASLFRRVLWRPELGVESYDYNTWPSGHVAAVCALALASLRLTPDKMPWRTASVTSAVIVVTVAAYASMASFAHRPSDTLGAMLISGAIFVLARPRRNPLYRLDRNVVLLIAAAGVCALLLAIPHALSAENLRATLAAGALLSMFGVACWVLLPECGAVGYDKSSRNCRPASS